MKIAIIHAGNVGFFPKYYYGISDSIKKNGDNVKLFVPNSGRNKRNTLSNQSTFGTRFNWFIHYNLYKLTGIQDTFSFFATLNLIRKIKKYSPDIIHLNLINDKILNIPLFVRYVNKNNIAIVWTMHDCRAFTGQCPYFDEVDCFRWKTGCGKCPICEAKIDNTNITWNIRRKWETKIKRMVIVTPSKWLANYVKQSFLKNYPVEVIYNGVDIDGFSKDTKLDVRKSVVYLKIKK